MNITTAAEARRATTRETLSTRLSRLGGRSGVLALALGLTGASALSGCGRSNTDDPRPGPLGSASRSHDSVPAKPTAPRPTPEGLERKARSEARLISEAVAINSGLPTIETGASAKIRPQEAVVDRAIAIMIVAIKGEGLEQDEVRRAIDSLGAATFFTPDEQAFIADVKPSRADRAKFAWQYECLGVLLWALGFDAELSRPDQIADAGRIVQIIASRGSKKVREEARLRSTKELLDEADLIYRYDWACVDARVGGKPKLDAVDCEIVVERHRTLNWLIGYQGQAWDDVSTDT